MHVQWSVGNHCYTVTVFHQCAALFSSIDEIAASNPNNEINDQSSSLINFSGSQSHQSSIIIQHPSITRSPSIIIHHSHRSRYRDRIDITISSIIIIDTYWYHPSYTNINIINHRWEYDSSFPPSHPSASLEYNCLFHLLFDIFI